MSDRFFTAAGALVARFRRERPLRGGSLLITLFGDAIAPRGGAVMLRSLIELAALYGLNEQLVRTAITRLADEGWLKSRRCGRLSEYRLSREGGERFAEATRQIDGDPDRAWAGEWTLVLVPGLVRGARELARSELGWAGFGELTPGVFAHPTMSLTDVERTVRRSTGLANAVVLVTTSAGADSDVRLAGLGWNLEELADSYTRFMQRFEPVRAALTEGIRPAGRPSFIVRTLLIHEYRKIHLRDPLLPATLLPPDWVGSQAYRLCRSIYERVTPPAEGYLSAHAQTLDGPLPEAGADLFERFGGLDVADGPSIPAARAIRRAR